MNSSDSTKWHPYVAEIIRPYLRPKYLIPLLLAIIALATGIFKAFDKPTLIFSGSQLTNSPVITGGKNEINYETNTQVRPDAKWLKFGLKDIKSAQKGYVLTAMSNVKIEFPDGQIAFLESVPEEDVAIAYTNTGCSELDIVEAYQRSSIEINEVCWIMRVTCDYGLLPGIDPGPRALNKPDECSKQEPQSTAS